LSKLIGQKIHIALEVVWKGVGVRCSGMCGGGDRSCGE
jgi:hypothetical protein